MRRRTQAVSNGTLWSDDDVIALDSLFRKHHSIYYIAKQLNRSPRAVLHKLYKYSKRSTAPCCEDPDECCDASCVYNGGDEDDADDGDIDEDAEDAYVREMKYADSVFEDPVERDDHMNKLCFAFGFLSGALVSVGTTVFISILNQSLRAMQ